MRPLRRCASLTLLVGVLLAPAVRADEGMWLYTAPPLKLLKDRYSFEPDAGWLEHLQKSSIRFPGGSGSFVSADGLVMTNQHVGRGALAKLSTADRNLVRDGFCAHKPADELKCHDMELLVLQQVADVTDKVNAAVKPGMSAADAEKARRAVMNTLEKDASDDKAKRRSDVVALYQGGQYHLYTYKKYTDIRLVFAPQAEAAHFGGDPDNFEFPRFCLDVCFFRAYENDKPVKVEHHLAWSTTGAMEGDLVFVSGHPGRTSRLNTLAHLELFRDNNYPLYLDVMRRREVVYKTWADRNAENARRAGADLLRVQNTRKLLTGMVAGLQDPAVMEQKRTEEKALREAVEKDASLSKQYGGAWAEIEDSVKAQREMYRPYQLLEASGRGLGSPWAFNSELFSIARTLVRYAEEKDKPNAERLREFRESNLPSLRQLLFSEAPIYEDFEIVKLADSLALFTETIGANAEPIRAILGDKSPQARAAELIKGTKLRDVSARKALFEGGAQAIEASDDPMIHVARLIDAAARDVRKQYEERVEEPQTQAYAKISKAIFALKGQNQYPDATFTLRLAFGPVKGYEEDGRHVTPFTTLAGAFAHADEHGNREPFVLPKRFTDSKPKLNLETPYNFVCTADIIGGNSGSPVVNRKGEVVGLIFDGNIQSLVADFAYTDAQARAVAVDARGIIETLRHVYDAPELVAELTRSK
jgi:hypothetical protein